MSDCDCDCDVIALQCLAREHSMFGAVQLLHGHCEVVNWWLFYERRGKMIDDYTTDMCVSIIRQQESDRDTTKNKNTKEKKNKPK